MDTSFEQKVRERAYHIWMAAGMDDGKAHDHWVKAEAAVADETGVPVKAKAKKTVEPKKAAAKVVASPKPAMKVAAPKAKTTKKAAPKATAKTSSAKH